MGVSTSGCSAIFAGGKSPETCSTSYAPVVADVLLGVIAVGAGGTGVAAGAAFGEAFGVGMVALGLVGVAGGIGHFVSAGTNDVGQCRRSRQSIEPYGPNSHGLWDEAEPERDPRRVGTDLEVALDAHYRSVGDYSTVETKGASTDVQVSFKGRFVLGLAVSLSDNVLGDFDYTERYGLTSIAPHLMYELVERSPDTFGFGIRVRPAWSWSTHDADGRDLPGGWPLIALILGTTDVWVDFGGGAAVALDDPRFAHLELGFRSGIVELQLGGALIGHDEPDVVVFVTRLGVRLTDRLTFGSSLELGGAFALSGGLAYRFTP